ncbi:MAG: permease [Firmicutes bacterium]|nr:permease [Bacillota bacterium]
MNNWLTVISKVLPVIWLLFLGNILNRLNFIKQDTVNDLKKIVVNLSLPALLFMAFAETRLEQKYLYLVLVIFLTCVVMLFLGMFFKKIGKIENNYYPALFSGFETGMMGYSLFLTVYGAANMYQLALVDLGQVVFVFFVLVSYLGKLNGKTFSAKELALSFLKSPVIIAILFGILVGATGLTDVIKAFPLSNSFLETLQLLSGLTTSLICLVIGYELRINPKKIGFPLLTTLLRMGVLLLFAYLINTLLIDQVFHLGRGFQIALYAMFLLPPPFVIPIFMEDQGESQKGLVLNTISIHIVLSIIGFLGLIVIY